jgi:hypothetical protein
MGREGFEPSKAEPTDLQSAPFDHSGTSPLMAEEYLMNLGLSRLAADCSGVKLCCGGRRESRPPTTAKSRANWPPGQTGLPGKPPERSIR